MKATNVGGNFALRWYVTVPTPQVVYAIELDVGEEFFLGLFPPGTADEGTGEQSYKPLTAHLADDVVDELLW